MNQLHLDKLFTTYMSAFPFLNNSKNREYLKWEAIDLFQKEWDPDAADFAAMFKRALSKAESLINNRIIQPARGILFLAENPESTEAIRSLLKDLFEADDGGDLDRRQEKIVRFTEKANALLNRYAPDRWRYRQDNRCGLFYLNLYAPADNFFYKPRQARAFRLCVEFEEYFGSGAEFSLKRYYSMCSQLVEEIRRRPALVRLHRERLTDKMYPDEDLHVLAYDIITCASVYNLYGDILFSRTNRQQNRHDRIRTKKTDSLEETLHSFFSELDDLIEERSAYKGFSVVGLEVRHRSYGQGRIIGQSDDSIIVSFREEEKKFLLPSSFTSGFLMTPDLSANEMVSNMRELDRKIEQKQMMISRVQQMLELVRKSGPSGITS